jgi:hypothetical protein
MTLNIALEAQFALLGPDNTDNEILRLRFGLACVRRVKHLLEDDDVLRCLQVFENYLDNQVQAADFEQARQLVIPLARSHPGSRSIDGTAHAAVSATHALAKAMSGRALAAAEYAAYAAVYAYGAYAVKDSASFEPEYAWQCGCLRELTSAHNALPILH